MSRSQGQNLIPQDLILPDPRPGTKGRCTQFELQAALIPDESRFEYQSARELARTVQMTVDSGFEEEYFLYFHGVTDSESEVLEKELRAVQLRNSVRFTFENALDAAILRIMPGPAHSRIAGNFFRVIEHKITSIPGHDTWSIHYFGATLLQIPGVRSKEGHYSLGPVTRAGWDAWPSVMIETGYSKALEYLRLDAGWWLINSAGKIRFVIIVQVMTDPLALHIEGWAMSSSGHRQTRQTNAVIPSCEQSFDIDEEGEVTSASSALCIPYDCIFDERNGDPPNAVLDKAELNSFARWMFQLLTGNSFNIISEKVV